jgi:hypothetical protein
MRLLNNRIVKDKTDKRINRAKEGRDGIVQFVDSINKYAIITVQGDDKSIIATWSENWESIPKFLRIGNACRVHHPKGNSNRWEMTGDANTIPTPVGDNPLLPTQPAGEDVIISGSSVLVYEDMKLVVEAGSFRINDVEYNLGGILLGNAVIGLMGEDPNFLMGFEYGGIVEIADAPDAPDFRVDLIYVGTNGEIGVRAGTPHETDPVAPELEADEAFIAFVVVPYEVTEIEQAWIGPAYTVPYLRTVETAMEFPDGMFWPDLNEDHATFTLYDQYDKPVIGNYSIRITITDGNGELSKGAEHWPPSTGQTISIAIDDGVANFIYRRGYIDGIAVVDVPLDESPTIHFEVVGQGAFVSDVFVKLYDSLGLIML